MIKRRISSIYGFHAVAAVVSQQSSNVEMVYILDRRDDKRLHNLVEQLEQLKVAYQAVTKKELNLLTNTTHHQGVMAMVAIEEKNNADLNTMLIDFPQKSLILVLDHIQDPHNLGACLRTAECIGVDLVVLPKDRACRVNDTVRKVASGAVDFLNILYVPNLVRALTTMKQQGYWIYGTAAEAVDSLDDMDFASRSVVIMGAEGKGMKNIVNQSCDQLMHIPMFGQVSSLNVSVAAGITLYEANKKISLII